MSNHRCQKFKVPKPQTSKFFVYFRFVWFVKSLWLWWETASYSDIFDFKYFSIYSMMSTMEQVACEDLKAFERRLTEIIASAAPSAMRWRVILLISSLCVAIRAFYWISDPITAEVPFLTSIMNHTFFSISTVVLLVMEMFNNFLFKILTTTYMLKILFLCYGQQSRPTMDLE